MHLAIEDGPDVISLLLLEELLSLGGCRCNLEFEATPEATLQVVRGVAFEVDAVLEDADASPDVLCLLDVLG
jgi:hypothetical protein